MFLLMANTLTGSTTSVGPVLLVYANFKMLVLRRASSPTVNPTKGYGIILNCYRNRYGTGTSTSSWAPVLVLTRYVRKCTRYQYPVQ